MNNFRIEGLHKVLHSVFIDLLIQIKSTVKPRENVHSKIRQSDTTTFALDCRELSLGKVRFYLGGGGWAGASEGRVISKYFTNWGGSNLFYTQPGEGRSIFWQGKNYCMSVS